jgi:hypothetical protein
MSSTSASGGKRTRAGSAFKNKRKKEIMEIARQTPTACIRLLVI